MKIFRRVALVAVATVSMNVADATTLNYHGTLQDGGKPADGKYDLQLTLYSAPDGGKVVAGPLTIVAVPVSNGHFSTQADFPTNNYSQEVWLSVAVRDDRSGEFASMPGRAAISASASNVCPGAWTLQGNAGNPTGSYLGTADTQPLTLEVNAQQVAQFSSSGGTSPNIVFGSAANNASPTIGGATIGGGGDSGSYCGLPPNGPCANSVNGDHGTIGGGEANTASSADATVSGGDSNTASGSHSTVSGGFFNSASSYASSVGGGQANFAFGDLSTVAGGDGNYAIGVYSSVAGGNSNTAGGDFSFAGGYGATIRTAAQAGNNGTCTSGTNCGDYGSFVWADASTPGTNFTSTGPNQFLIQASGNVGINTNAPKSTLHVQHGGGAGAVFSPVGGTVATFENNGNDYITLISPAANQTAILFGNPSSVSDGAIVFNPNTGALANGFAFNAGGNNTVMTLDHLGDLTVNGTATKPGGGSWTATSDRRIKQNIVPIQDALDTVMRLRPVSFHYTPEYRALEGGLADKGYRGFVAQEFAEVFPEAVTSTDQHVPGAPPSDEAILALDPNPAIITTVAAVQELAVRDQSSSEEIAALKQENADLRRQLDEVLVRLNKLEAKTRQ